VIHGVARQHLVHGQPERESQHDPGLLGAVVALLRELLEEVITASHTDLPQREAFEHRQHERLHVPLLQVKSALGEPAFQSEVFEPVGDKVPERAVWCER